MEKWQRQYQRSFLLMSTFINKKQCNTKRLHDLWLCLWPLIPSLRIFMPIKSVTFRCIILVIPTYFRKFGRYQKEKKTKKIGNPTVSSNQCYNTGIILSRSLHAHMIKQTKYACVFTRMTSHYTVFPDCPKLVQ